MAVSGATPRREPHITRVPVGYRPGDANLPPASPARSQTGALDMEAATRGFQEVVGEGA
jgi:hypothetical protein